LTDSQTSKFREIKYEKFYTPWQTAHELYDRTLLIVGNLFDNFVEPSAGRGAFLSAMPPNKRIGIDIDMASWGYGKICQEIEIQNFFDFIWPEGRTITIGNPPFGRRGKLAMKFLNISAENSDVVAFILPAIFSKFTFINRVHPYFHLIHETPVTEFEDNVKVKCVFQIWERRAHKRERIVRQSSCDEFTMTHRHISRTTPEELEQLKQDSTVAIQQIGGRVIPLEEIKRGSIWFIKGGDPEAFKRIDYSHLHKHHLGAISLTKADIVEGYLNTIKR
tara:strand:- start:227 stop:1057 length:831 start_codon:yes stop_codon:yes gene_type:complete